MKGSKFVLTALALTLLVASAPLRADEHPAKMVDNAWKAAVLAGDLEAVVALYAPDAVVYPPDAFKIQGTEEIRAYWTGFLEAMTIQDVEFEGTFETHGDVSVGWGTWKLTAMPKAGGEPIMMAGRASTVVQKIDGRWLYVLDHASVPLPPPPSE